MLWRNWQDLGGSLKGTPAIAGGWTRDVAVAARSAAGRVAVCGRGKLGWYEWLDMGLTCVEAPAAVSSQGRFVIAARGTDNALWVGGFQPWANAGGSLSSGPAIASWWLDANVEIFARGSDGAVQWHTLGGVQWRSLGQRIVGRPAAVAPGPGAIHVFARRDGDSHLVHARYDFRQWSAWADLGDVAASAPCAVSRAIGQIEVYFANPSGTLVRRKFALDAQGALVPAAPETLAPQVFGDPAAASFGPWHVEVFQTRADSKIERLFAEGVHPEDDAGLALLGANAVGSSPSAWGRASTRTQCIGRDTRDELTAIPYEDGYWGEWQDLGGFVDSDPVAVSPFHGRTEVVARDAGQQVARWTCHMGAWRGPTVLPLPQGRFVRDKPVLFAAPDGTVRILVRTSVDRLSEAIIRADGTVSPWTDLSGPVTSQPELVHVPHSALPAPFPGMQPAFVQAGGTWIAALRPSGTTSALFARRFTGAGWSPWAAFPTPGTPVRRPIPVLFETGYGYETGVPRAGEVSSAGWIGREATNTLMHSASFWERKATNWVSWIGVTTTPWAPTGGIPLISDPTGIVVSEPAGGDPPSYFETITHLFARRAGGHLTWRRLATLRPPDGAWTPFGATVAGDAVPLENWERYENARLVHVVAITSGGTLIHRVGGHNAPPARIRPNTTVIPLPGPAPRPRPRPPRPIR